MKLTVEVGLSKIPGDMEDMQVDPPDTLQFRITWLLIPDGRVDGVGATRLPNPFRVTRKQFGPVRVDVPNHGAPLCIRQLDRTEQVTGPMKVWKVTVPVAGPVTPGGGR
ncbi:hypothetical protein GCM10010203_52570 [Actinomadura yumaensis]|uniref:hypothetical protein n=1 Tax=Brevundimonas aurantiaca TaxID=74316 RepID=UPI000C93D4D5|nr:hypothetical protein [Brevundimonas sp.]HAF81231.1 hypothetical protein [Brevundimonas sp.]